MKIKSSVRNYKVTFSDEAIFDESFFLIDRKVYDLHTDVFKKIDISKIILIDALETNKTYNGCSIYIKKLIDLGIKRGQTICAIGGGIIQDIVGFITSIIYRGITWNFYPTTLLAQCDSCIGGKTSINFNNYKNLIGNFNPPSHIIINTKYLQTLDSREIQSGLGEILKVAFIDKFDRINLSILNKNIQQNTVDETLIKKSLEIKKEIIEIDEFDKGLRNIMNFGHTFGHAIESITNFKIPHGIAVGIGINIANNISRKLYNVRNNEFEKILGTFLHVNEKYHNIFKESYSELSFIEALKRDKKNKNNFSLSCILLNSEYETFKTNLKLEQIKNIMREVI